MKRLVIAFVAILMASNGFAQKQSEFMEEDVMQFYRTIAGDYVMAVDDSTTAMVHLTPIWENDRYQWLYLEAEKGSVVVLQKVVEISPKNDKVFKVKVYDLKDAGQFAGKWGNPNFFDGFGRGILKGGNRLSFLKTSDFTYQSHWERLRTMDCFPQGDLLHFKFVQEDERFYIKRMPKGTNRILGYEGLKEISE